MGIVEINLRDGSAWVVEQSKAPPLTAKVLLEKGQPIQTVECLHHGQNFHVDVRHGMPLSLSIKRAQVLEQYRDDPDLETKLRQLMLSRMIADPLLSYEGEGEGEPVEELGSYLDAFWTAYSDLNHPRQDAIYQVAVRRVSPVEVAAMLRNTFEAYPVGRSSVPFDQITDADALEREAREKAEFRVLVTSTILDPITSLNGEDHRPDTEKDETAAYPIESVSERVLTTLHNAYKAFNVPEAGSNALRMFQRRKRNGSRT